MDDKKTDKFALQRDYMIRIDLRGRDIVNADVLKVMDEIPRQEFVPENYKSMAYTDGPLPIGCGQTISQPYIVALMTQALEIKKDSTVLEIGTGRGYQTAILASLAEKVYTIESIAQLSEAAQTTLAKLGFKNIKFCIADGSCGWPEDQKFDRIIFTAAAPEIPEPLLEQLTEGGIIVGPIGGEYSQTLVCCQKKIVGNITKAICPVRFVKLLGQYGFDEEQF